LRTAKKSGSRLISIRPGSDLRGGGDATVARTVAPAAGALDAE
jgi:hypothetical protein